MAIKKFLSPSLILIILSISTILHFAHADQRCSPTRIDLSCAGQETYKCPAVLARDAITLSVKEIKDVMDFARSIPKLESVGASAKQEVTDCVKELLNSLSEDRKELSKLRILQGTTLVSDASIVKQKVIANSIKLEDMCKHALRDIDHTISIVLKRKLSDIELTVKNVVARIKHLEHTAEDIKC